MEADPRLGALEHLQRRHDRPLRVGEQKHAAVSQPPDRSASVTKGDLLDERGEARRQSGGDLVSLFLGETGVVYPVRSTKQIAGGRSTRWRRPARSRAVSASPIE